MSLNEILEELDQLSPEELRMIQGKLELLRRETGESPELLAEIDEGIRSADEGPLIPLNEVIQEIRSWNTKSS